MRRKVALILSIMVLGVLAACGKTTTKVDSSLNVAVTDQLGTLDSTKYSDTFSVEAIQNVYEGLYTYNQKNKPVLAAAKSVTTNDAKTVYTYKLRDEKWSSGTAVTANDFVYAWQKLANPKTASPNSQRIDILKNGYDIRNGKMAVNKLGVKAIDKTTLEVTLAQPISYLPEVLTGAPFVPQNEAYVKKQGDKYGTDSKHMIVNGPYKLTDWTGTNNKWSYVKNTNYWNAKSVKLTQVDVQVVKDGATAGKLYQTGKIDFSMLANDYVKQYKNEKGFATRKTPLIGYLGFNTKREATGNKHIRKALAIGFNKSSLASKILNDGSSELNGIVPANFVSNPVNGKDYRKEAGDLLAFNKKEAKAEWEKGLKEIGKKDLTIEILGSDTPEAKQVIEYLQAQLESNLPGLTINARNIPIKSRLAATTAYQFDVVYGTWTPDYADPINFISDGGAYHLSTDYKNAQYLKDLDQAKNDFATNPTKRWDSLIDAEKQIVGEDAYMVPVFQGAMAYLLNPDIAGIHINPYGTTLFYRDMTIK
ncbi:peptide ABC transporter substrate-binding protein [Dellaglioa algida]|nr:peptide ABC transporter substrate-binding protein [Dellaglioa algida]MDK1732818.1 peptide ABC transporter substrate-binding protein [Dellaglioa algida]MDK1734342.1 peptide ABC transporter substrate-binding protein [Dellaglioa algida]